MSAYTNHGKTISSKRKNGRKSILTEKDRRTLRRIVSKNHTATAEQMTAGRLHKKFPTKFHKSNIHSITTIVRPLITQIYAQMRKRCCRATTTEPGHQTTGNMRDMVRWAVIHAVPYIRKSLRLKNTQGSLQSWMPGSNSETRWRFSHGLDTNIVVFFWFHCYHSWSNYCNGVFGQAG
jgi:hypothetical protein